MLTKLISRLKEIASAPVRLFALFSLAFLAACDLPPIGIGGGESITPGAPVQVALLVPSGSSQGSDALLATNFENAARLAVADLQGANIDLRVYATAANPTQAASAASQAIADGARVIVGPLYGEAANAAGLVASQAGVNVLAFSNNPTIAGGNVYLLGATFNNTANRLVSYGVRNGINSYLVAHGQDLGGEIGRDAIVGAVQSNGATLAGVQSYPLSQQGIVDSIPAIAAAANSNSVDAIFSTAGVNADLAIVATQLQSAGVNFGTTRLMGLTRWDAAPQALALPALQNGIFAIPDQGSLGGFEQRYAAAYGEAPHPLAGLAYDGIAAVGALAARGDAPTAAALTQGAGFQGTQGAFRFFGNGLNQRALAVATIQNGQVVILDAAPRSFAGAGF